PPPQDFLSQSPLQSRFFSEDGAYDAGLSIITYPTVKKMAGPAFQDEKETELFARFISKTLQWNPQDRPTAEQLTKDEWLTYR
ncbi:hypothetical protein H0H93_004907, partial [Arthromyces matolae]